MSLNLAASLDFVQRNGNGRFAFNGDAERGAPAQQPNGEPEGAPEAGAFKASDDTEAVLSSVMQSTMQGAQIAAIHSGIANGEVDAHSIARLASQAGQEPHQMAQQVQQIYDGFHSAISSRMEGLGVHDLELFDEYVHNDSRTVREMQDAGRKLMMHNDTSGIDRIAAAYTEALDEIDPEAVAEALEAAGMRFTYQRGQSIILHMPGGMEVPYRQAVRQGIIKVSRAR